MEQIGEGYVVGRPARRVVRGRWWIAAGTAVVAVALAAAVILVRMLSTPLAVPCPLPQVPGAASMISWASDSRSAIFVQPTNGVSLLRVPELTVKALPDLPEYPAEVALPAGGRPFAAAVYNPRSPLATRARSRGAAVHYFLLRLSEDGKRWEQCLDNLFPFQISPNSRHVATADRDRLRVWRLPDLSQERSVPLPPGCAGRPSNVYWSDDEEIALYPAPAPKPRWRFRLATGTIEPAGWPMPLLKVAGFQVARRGALGRALRRWLARKRGTEPVEDWDLLVGPASAPSDRVSLGRRTVDPANDPIELCLTWRETAVPAIPSPDGKYAFVPAADGSVRLWARGQRAR